GGPDQAALSVALLALGGVPALLSHAPHRLLALKAQLHSDRARLGVEPDAPGTSQELEGIEAGGDGECLWEHERCTLEPLYLAHAEGLCSFRVANHIGAAADRRGLQQVGVKHIVEGTPGAKRP